jgi:hypothetical protein
MMSSYCNPHVTIPLTPSAGAALLLLGDRPSGVTARRMGDSIFGSVAPLFGAACAASLAANVAAATGAIPGVRFRELCSWHWRQMYLVGSASTHVGSSLGRL